LQKKSKQSKDVFLDKPSMKQGRKKGDTVEVKKKVKQSDLMATGAGQTKTKVKKQVRKDQGIIAQLSEAKPSVSTDVGFVCLFVCCLTACRE